MAGTRQGPRTTTQRERRRQRRRHSGHLFFRGVAGASPLMGVCPMSNDIRNWTAGDTKNWTPVVGTGDRRQGLSREILWRATWQNAPRSSSEGATNAARKLATCHDYRYRQRD
jgi:hypothetical protein